MDGTSKYINLKLGPGGDGLPPGIEVGDVLQWDGEHWEPRLLSALITELLTPKVYNIPSVDTIPDAVPVGNKLVQVTIIYNGHDPVTVSAGTSLHGTDLLDNFPMTELQWVDIPVNRVLSFTDDKPIYIESPGYSGGLSSVFTVIVETKYYFLFP